MLLRRVLRALRALQPLRRFSDEGVSDNAAGGAVAFSAVTVRAGATKVVIPRDKVEATFTRSSGAVRVRAAPRADARTRLPARSQADQAARPRRPLPPLHSSPGTAPRSPVLQGGQNVNKLSTKAQLRLPLAGADWLDEHTRQRLRALYASSVTREGALLVTSQRHRTQAANLADALRKLQDMVLAAAQVPAQRELRAGLTEHAKAARTLDKRQRGEVKARRRGGGGGGEDD